LDKRGFIFDWTKNRAIHVLILMNCFDPNNVSVYFFSITELFDLSGKFRHSTKGDHDNVINGININSE